MDFSDFYIMNSKWIYNGFDDVGMGRGSGGAGGCVLRVEYLEMSSDGGCCSIDGGGTNGLNSSLGLE